MKRKITVLIVLIMILMAITGCTSENKEGDIGIDPKNGATTIELGKNIVVYGKGAEVNNEGILISQEGIYELEGILEDGMIMVEVPEGQVELILNGLKVVNNNGPAIFFSEIKEGIVTLSEGTSNYIQDGGKSEFDAALYTNGNLTIKGKGRLKVLAADEGISSTMHIRIEDGDIDIDAYEDGINANNDNVSTIEINGGNLYIESQTGDGIDSNGSIEINGGNIISLSATEDASGGLDADGEVIINSGTVVATGTMLSLPSQDSPQKSIMIFFNDQQSNSTVSVQKDGEEIYSIDIAKEFRVFFYSSELLEENVSYDVFIDGQKISSATTANLRDGNMGRPDKQK